MASLRSSGNIVPIFIALATGVIFAVISLGLLAPAQLASPSSAPLPFFDILSSIIRSTNSEEDVGIAMSKSPYSNKQQRHILYLPPSTTTTIIDKQ